MTTKQKPTQTTIIKQAIESLINSGETKLPEIYRKIVEEYGVKRPVVRRVKRELLEDLRYKISIIEEISVGQQNVKEKDQS